jgi:hypothetical protein
LLVGRDGSAFVAATHAGRPRPRRRAGVSVHAIDPAGRRVRSSRLTLHDTSGHHAGTVLLRIGSSAGTRLIASQARALAIDKRNRIVVAGAAYDDDAAIREDLGRSYFAVARLKG